MDNQHRQIKGYRELSQGEIDLMNLVKRQGGDLEALLAAVTQHVSAQRQLSHTAEAPAKSSIEQQRLDAAQPERWAAIARTHFQEGLMALTRAVAQPGFF